jgi:NAD(P)-dependent dehydrogenase (short-subunit alcohol dehydrogenase family)
MESPDMGSRELTGKVAVVTGAAQGVGSHIAELFARDGASVVLADIQTAEVANVASRMAEVGLKTLGIHVDIRDPDSARAMVESTIKTFGGIDLLINNAAIDSPLGLAWELADDHWRMIIDTDLSGAWWCTKAAIPHMIARRGGRIIFISSTAARRGSRGTSVAYNAAKAGLIGLTIGLSNQLEKYGILVNAVTPGPTGTGRPMTSDEVAAEAEFPLGIVGPEPVAHACLYLARASGDWISGSVLNVSGGRWRG